MSARAPRALGQNFLVHGRSIERIHRALELGAGEPVLEIGPGRGALTAGLLEAASRVVAVEIDPRMAQLLRKRFDEARLSLIESDILQLPLARICERLDTTSVVVVGNLPYWISKPVALKLVEERVRVRRAVLMFQREVAARLTARHGARDYGPLGILCGAVFRIERLFDLAPARFRPAPKVHSSVTRWTPRLDGVPSDAELARLRRCLAACFSRRRKTLRNNLRAALGSEAAALRLLESCAVDGALRAEALEPAVFRRLAAAWESASADDG